MKKGFYTLVLFILGTQAFGQTWTGSSNTNWNTASNWSPNTVPTSSSSVVINTAVANQPKLTGSTTVKDLTVSAGSLDLNTFTLTATGDASFTGGTLKNGAFIASSKLVEMKSTTFTGPLSFTKTGNGGSAMSFYGGNTFNGAVSIINNSNKDMQLASTAADIYNGDVNFQQLDASGNLYPAYAGNNTFKGDISTAGTVKQIVFGQGGGIVTISGNAIQDILGASAQSPLIKALVMNTTSNLNLQVATIIGTSLTLTNGVIYSTSATLLTINDNATITGGSNASYVYGPMKKIGNEAFTFPTGKAGLFAPIGISAPSASTDQFTAEYFNTATPHTLTLLDLAIHHISKEEYWSLNRNSGLSSVVVTLSYSVAERSGPVTNLGQLKISRWNSLLNLSSDLGNGGTTGNTTAGTVKTAAATGSFGDFAMASSSSGNPLVLTMAPKTLSFNNPTTTDNVNYTFTNVSAGVDAIISIIGSKNASVSDIDNSGSYKNSWQPFIKITNATTKTTDSSYVEFKVKFVRNNIAEVQKAVAMTIIDQDGEGVTNGYKELLKVSLPATPKGVANSQITVSQDANWLTLVGAPQNYNSIDTTVYAAMSQINFTDVSSYTMRVGVLGKISGGTVREASFAFQNFQSMNVVLPVELISLEAKSVGTNAKVSWVTGEEENLNRFEVYRSVDGVNYSFVGTVKANGNKQTISNYSFTDVQVNEAGNNVFYKLNMIDNNDNSKWSPVALLVKSSKVNATVGSVYPNPTKGDLTVSFNHSDSEVSVEVVDMFGKTLESYTNVSGSALTMDLSNFDNGIYFIRVINAEGTATLTRFIKN